MLLLFRLSFPSVVILRGLLLFVVFSLLSGLFDTTLLLSPLVVSILMATPKSASTIVPCFVNKILAPLISLFQQQGNEQRDNELIWIDGIEERKKDS